MTPSLESLKADLSAARAELDSAFRLLRRCEEQYRYMERQNRRPTVVKPKPRTTKR